MQQQQQPNRFEYFSNKPSKFYNITYNYYPTHDGKTTEDEKGGEVPMQTFTLSMQQNINFLN